MAMTRNRDTGEVVFSAKDIRITKGFLAALILLGPALGVGAARLSNDGHDIKAELIEVQRQLAIVIEQNKSLEKRLDRIEDRQH